ncbi:MAG: biopolymer transporter ExbD [Xanthomonadales bacterium]|jgi:biopolymer transport protein ExbD|nr:biopolymer transporter ExbD [Xanthomonadales bacterium]
MRFTAPDAGDDPEINIIALIDVILVLLIFFMATATIDSQQRLRIVLPEASASVSEADRGQSLLVEVTPQGRYRVGGEELLDNSTANLMRVLAAAAGDRRDQRVLLRADGQSSHQSVVTAMDAIGQLGFTNLSIATVRPAQDATAR